jgi:hypothetical protein
MFTRRRPAFAAALGAIDSLIWGATMVESSGVVGMCSWLDAKAVAKLPDLIVLLITEYCGE